MLFYYKGPSRRGAGLTKGGLYEIVDSSWASKVKIRTDTGAEVFVPRGVPKSAKKKIPSVRFIRQVKPEWHVSSGGMEFRGLGLNIIFTTRKNR